MAVQIISRRRQRLLFVRGLKLSLMNMQPIFQRGLLANGNGPYPNAMPTFVVVEDL
jgi:hypothetical protein